jgi:hypothetical protein
MFQLNRNKTKTNRNSLIRSIFAIFYRKFRVFPVFSGFFLFFRFFSFFSVCFETVCFGCFSSIPKQRVSMFLLNWNKQKTPPKQFKREYIWVFFRKFRVVSVCYETVLFVSVVSIKVQNTETNRNFLFFVSRKKPKQTRIRSCFGLFRFEPKFIIVCFEDTLHPPHPPDRLWWCKIKEDENLTLKAFKKSRFWRFKKEITSSGLK